MARPDDEPTTGTTIFGEFGSLAREAGSSFTDGAGSERWVPECARRVGAGAATFSLSLDSRSFDQVAFLFGQLD